jgi:predicted DNA-binding transcriptional regulator YafY
MKLERLLAITMLLINRKRITAAELADYFEVSVRTIHRDIDAINRAGIPIVAYQGVNGGFGIMDNYKIDRQVLTADDINSMIIALKGAATSLDDQKFASTIAKLKILAPEPEVKTLKPDQLILDFSPWGGNRIQQAKVDLIKKAISEEMLINFKYTNYQGEVNNRQVEPMALVLKGFTWYFYGYCRTKEDYRLFRLSRIRDVRTLAEKFERREKNLEDLSWEQQWQPKHSVKLRLRFAPRLRAVIEDYFDAENVREGVDGFLVVETELPDDEWSYHYILNYGEGVEVLEPQYIREIIREKARRIWELYR